MRVLTLTTATTYFYRCQNGHFTDPPSAGHSSKSLAFQQKCPCFRKLTSWAFQRYQGFWLKVIFEPQSMIKVWHSSSEIAKENLLKKVSGVLKVKATEWFYEFWICSLPVAVVTSVLRQFLGDVLRKVSLWLVSASFKLVVTK